MEVNAEKLYDAATWADPKAVYDVFEKMRKHSPVHFCQMPGFPDFWHITKHEDIFEVERRTDAFLAEPRMWVNPDIVEDAIREMTGGSLNILSTFPAIDAPKHPKMRMITQAWFAPKNLEALQARIDESAKQGCDVLIERGGECDFAKDVALNFPLRVILDVLGLPEEDFSKMLALTQEFFGATDPELSRDEEVQEGNPFAAKMGPIQDFMNYFASVAMDRRANPRDDVASVIANAEIDGEPLSMEDIIGYYVVIATAGHDTTSYSLSEAVRQLAQNPELFKALKEKPDEVAPKITEEAIRLATPVRHFVRTASQDFELNGQTIKKGDPVILWYPSGSRDEEVFASPDEFRIDRDQKVRHAAFGHAAHMCLGMHLARLEIVTFLKRFAKEVEGLKMAGDVKHMQSNVVSGIKSLPIKATVAAS